MEVYFDLRYRVKGSDLICVQVDCVSMDIFQKVLDLLPNKQPCLCNNVPYYLTKAWESNFHKKTYLFTPKDLVEKKVVEQLEIF